MRKKVLWIIIMVIGLILLIFLLKGGFSKDNGVKVAVDKVTMRDITELVTASGKVYPEVEVKVSPDISGEIIELYVQEGDSVNKGQILARIYADIYSSSKDRAAAAVSQQQAMTENARATIEANKAQVAQTEAAYIRQKKLVEEKVISRSEFETAESQYRSAVANYNAALQNVQSNVAAVSSAQAGLTEANKNLSRTIILAPMSGVVSLLNVKKGERVVGTAQMAGTEMMRVADISVMEAQVDVGENDITKVHLGDSATVEVDAYNYRKFKGIVTQIANGNANASQTTTTSTSSTDVTNYKVHIRLIPESYKDLIGRGRKAFPFRPGMSASADIQTRKKSGSVSVPILAVTTRESDADKAKAAEKKELDKAKGDEDKSSNSNDLQEVVFVLQPDNTVKKVKVITGIQDNEFIEVTTGLKIGETVVSAPFNEISKMLKDGTKVNVTSKDKLFDSKKE